MRYRVKNPAEMCECGALVPASRRTHHLSTKKHRMKMHVRARQAELRERYPQDMIRVDTALPSIRRVNGLLAPDEEIPLVKWITAADEQRTLAGGVLLFEQSVYYAPRWAVLIGVQTAVPAYVRHTMLYAAAIHEELRDGEFLRAWRAAQQLGDGSAITPLWRAELAARGITLLGRQPRARVARSKPVANSL